jgi:hypothetical protein
MMCRPRPVPLRSGTTPVLPPGGPVGQNEGGQCNPSADAELAVQLRDRRHQMRPAHLVEPLAQPSWSAPRARGRDQYSHLGSVAPPVPAPVSASPRRAGPAEVGETTAWVCTLGVWLRGCPVARAASARWVRVSGGPNLAEGADAGLKQAIAAVLLGDVVGVFTNPEALLRLACAVLVEAHDEWQTGDRADV